MSIIYTRADGATGESPVSPDNAFPVQGSNGVPVVVGGQLRSVTITPTGVVAGAAYASGDAVGARMDIGGLVGDRMTGTLVAARLLDMDKEALAADLVLFNAAFTATADNAAFDPSDGDADACFAVVNLAGGDFTSFNDWAVGFRANLNIPLYLPLSGGVLYAQMVTRGAPNLTAASDYRWTLWSLAD